MEKVSVSSNWDIDNQHNLNKIITYCSSENKEFEFENVTTDSCVCLTRSENNSFGSKPVLIIKSKNLIKQVDILSEGNFIEVFGDCDEYLCSSSSVFIDDWDGMAVYYTKIILPGIKNCTLMFKRMKNNSRLWIYGVQLMVVESAVSSSEEQFNFENVNKLIKNSNISEKADKFKTFFEMYMKNSTHLRKFSSQSPEFKVLMNFIKNENKVQFESSKKNIGDCLNDSSITNDKLSFENSVTSMNSDVIKHLESYVDNKLIKMKEEVLEEIDIKLNKYQEEMNNKLETIIQLLSSTKT